MNDQTAQRLALTVIAAIERRLAQPGALPPASRRIGTLLAEIAADVHHPGVREGVRRLAVHLADDDAPPVADASATPSDPVAAGLIS